MLRTKLRGDDDFIHIGKNGDVVELLQKIHGVYRQITTNTSICDPLMKPRSTVTYIDNNQKTIMKPTSEYSRTIPR